MLGEGGLCPTKRTHMFLKSRSVNEFDSRSINRFLSFFFFVGYRYPMQKGDAARYVLLHRFGGVYLDMDITCLVSMDTILRTVDLFRVHTVLGHGPFPRPVDTPVLMSKPNNPFMEYCMRNLRVMDHSYLLPFLTVFFSTGPYFLSLTYFRYPCQGSIHRLDLKYTRSLYFHHDLSASWQTWDYYIIKFFEHYFFPLLVLALLVRLLLPVMSSRVKYLLLKPQIFKTL